jgi:hypothetical protein
MALQMKAVLEAATWPTGAQEKIFGGPKGQRVAVFADTPKPEQLPNAYPCCLIVMEDGEPDEDHQELIEHTFRIVTGAQIRGADRIGERALIGATVKDASSLGRSANRGVAELAARVRAELGFLSGSDGAPLQLLSTALSSPFLAADLTALAFDEQTVTAQCTTDLSYSAPQQIAYAGGPGFAWTWLGPHCSSRFDFVRYKLVKKAGTDPPTDPTDGTMMYTGTGAAHAEEVLAGNTVAAFAEYAMRDRTTPTIEGNSDPVYGSYLVVT